MRGPEHRWQEEDHEDEGLELMLHRLQRRADRAEAHAGEERRGTIQYGQTDQAGAAESGERVDPALTVRSALELAKKAHIRTASTCKEYKKPSPPTSLNGCSKNIILEKVAQGEFAREYIEKS